MMFFKLCLSILDKVDMKEYLMYGHSDEDIYSWKQAIDTSNSQRNILVIGGPTKSLAPPINVEFTQPPSYGNVSPYSDAPPSYETSLKQSTYTPPPYSNTTQYYPDLHQNTPSAPLLPQQSVSEKVQTTPEDPDKLLIRHKVLTTDTLSGIAVRYNVSTEAIKLTNKMQTDQVFGYNELWIPYDSKNPTPIPQEESKEYEKRNLIRKFMKITDTDVEEEASYYLEEAGWDVDKAVEAYNGDAQWEDAKEKEDLMKGWGMVNA